MPQNSKVFSSKTSIISKTPIILRPSVLLKNQLNNITKEQQLSQLEMLSRRVAEKVFEPVSHIQLEMNILQKVPQTHTEQPTHTEQHTQNVQQPKKDKKARHPKKVLKTSRVTKITRISKVIHNKSLKQVAQVVYHHLTGRDIFEILWDKKNHIAILDGPICSWQIPNWTIRDIIHDHFDDELPVNILNENTILNKSVSRASPVVVHIQPTYYEELDWKN